MKLKKRIIPMFLCITLLFTLLGSVNVFAAAANKGLKVGFNGKEITLITKLDGEREDTASVSSIKKNWGKCKVETVKEIYSNNRKIYTFKKGKTEIRLDTNSVQSGKIGAISIIIKDKNGSVAGVKVGMTKAQAVKKLQSVYGKKRLLISNKNIALNTLQYLYVQFELKNGKVSQISWNRS